MAWRLSRAQRPKLRTAPKPAKQATEQAKRWSGSAGGRVWFGFALLCLLGRGASVANRNRPIKTRSGCIKHQTHSTQTFVEPSFVSLSLADVRTKVLLAFVEAAAAAADGTPVAPWLSRGGWFRGADCGEERMNIGYDWERA